MRHIREARCARSGAIRVLWGLVVAASVLLAGGCGTRKAAVGEPGDMAAGQDELFQYVPKDDGIPLSSAELAVLNSTGELDVKLSHDAMDDIAIQYKYFLHKARPTFERFLRRAEVYLPYVKQVFKERGLPEDLAYIAFIESGYNPFVVSRAGAAGTWQFMPFTGQKYGLAQDWWMDERHDTFKATHAAADYLAKLYGDFKDWHLAIAAYNAGEGKIGRALEGTGTKSFFELVRKNGMLDERAQLKDETKQYVPRFLVVCKMMRNLEKLGFAPPDPGAATTLTKVEAGPGTDLVAVAQTVGMDWAEFSAHNPAYKRHVSPVDRSSALYVPGHAKDRALACLGDARAQRAGGWKSYTVAKNDSWQRISASSGVPVGVLKRVNGNTTLRAGVSLRIPGGASPAAVQIARATPAAAKKKGAPSPALIAQRSADSRGRAGAAPEEKPRAKPEKSSQAAHAAGMPVPKTEAKPAAQAENTHVAKPGDTVYSIARTYDRDVDSVLCANQLASPQQLRVGQKVRIPGVSSGASSTAANTKPQSSSKQDDKTGNTKTSKPESKAQTTAVAAAAPSAGTYRVQPGDTMWSIARKHKVPPQDLMRINKLSDSAMLRPGDTIKVALN